jgi:hypothetical protein
MTDTMALHHYLAFGMALESQVALQLPPANDSPAPLGKLSIVFGTIAKFPKVMHRLAAFQYGIVGDELVVRLPSVAMFLVSEHSITIASENAMDAKLLARFLVGGLLGIYMIKRGCLLLHGSAVIHKSRAVCLVGDQGSGKSTTAAKLASVSLPVLCDDLIPLLPRDSGRLPLVLPGIPRPKLLPDAYGRLVGPIETASAMFDGVDKYQTVFVESQEPTELGCLCVLSPQPDHNQVSIQEIRGMEKVSLILAHASIMQEIRPHDTFFTSISTILAMVPVYRIFRPVGQDSLQDVSDAILAIDL